MDSDYSLAIAGSKGKLVVWNLEDNPSINAHFPASASQKKAAPRPEVVAIEESESESEDEGEDEDANPSDDEDGDESMEDV